MEHTVVSERLYEPHFPHLSALRKELESCAVYYLEPRHLTREAAPRKEVRSIGERGENLAAFLNTLKLKQNNRRAFFSLQKAVKVVLPGEPLVDLELTKEGLVTLTVERGGVRFSSRLFRKVPRGSLAFSARRTGQTPCRQLGTKSQKTVFTRFV